MQAGRAKSLTNQKLRIKNMRGESMKSDCKTVDSFTFETANNQLIRTFVRNRLLRVKNRS